MKLKCTIVTHPQPLGRSGEERVMPAAPGGERGGSAHSSRASSRHSSRRSSAASGSPSHRHRDSRAGSESPERAGRAGSATSQQSGRSGRSHVSYKGDVKANDGPAEDDAVPGKAPSCSLLLSVSQHAEHRTHIHHTCCTRPPPWDHIMSCTAQQHGAVTLRTELGGLQDPAAEAAETEAELVERVGQPTFRRRPIRATRKTSSFRCCDDISWDIIMLQHTTAQMLLHALCSTLPYDASVAWPLKQPCLVV